MSRCFPFPPPGYEKSLRVEDIDLLAKEKHKEKKHRKERKDKEKREGKEKKNKDKERSKEKHGDKKDQKEKHKDKKDRDKDKGKNRSSDGKKVEEQPECYHEEKLGPNSMQNNGIKDFKYVQDLAKRIRDEDKATGSQIGQKLTVTDQRRVELPGRILECNAYKLEEKAKDQKEVDKKINGQWNHVEARGLGNSVVQGFSGIDRKRFKGISKPVEKNDTEKQLVEKEKNRHKETDHKGDKQKDRDREKKSRSNDKSWDKEKEKEEKVKEIVELNKDQLKLKDSKNWKDNGKGLPSSCNVRSPDASKASSKNPPGEGSVGKRKELEINGLSHDDGIRSNKLPSTVSSSQLITENGRKIEPYQTAVHFASEFHGAVGYHKVDDKEHEINGLRKVQDPIVCSTKHLSTIDRSSENCEAKLPHPHSEYLNQILSTVPTGVPKVEDWSDFDDGEWLFCSNSLQSKKARVGSPGGDGIQQVWAEVVSIESAGVTALPYVIPF